MLLQCREKKLHVPLTHRIIMRFFVTEEVKTSEILTRLRTKFSEYMLSKTQVYDWGSVHISLFLDISICITSFTCVFASHPLIKDTAPTCVSVHCVLHHLSESVQLWVPPPASLDANAVTSVVYVNKFVDQCTNGDTTEYMQVATYFLCVGSRMSNSLMMWSKYPRQKITMCRRSLMLYISWR